MKQLEVVEAPKYPLSTKVKVEVTLEEVAIFRTLMGKESTSSIERKMRDNGFAVTYTGLAVDPTGGYYRGLGEVLKVHGYDGY